MGPVAQLVFKTSAVVQPTARSVRLRRRSAEANRCGGWFCEQFAPIGRDRRATGARSAAFRVGARASAASRRRSDVRTLVQATEFVATG